jgi:hypothetical protein
MRTNILFCSLLLCWSTALFAQQDSVTCRFPGEHQYGKARIYLNDRKSTFYKVSRLTIQDDSLTLRMESDYNPTGEVRLKKVHLSDVYIVNVNNGTYAAEYCIAGALVCGAAALLGVNDNSDYYNSYSYEDTEMDSGTKKSMVLGFTLAGAVIGGIWGASTQKWQTIYRQGHVSQGKPDIKFRLAYFPQEKGMGIALKLGIL